MLSGCWPAKRIGLPGRNSSCSLSNATRLPQNVTAPMMPEAAVATSTTSVGSTARSASAAPATSTEAAPPNPLSSATICGIAVIWIRVASSTPITAPISTAARIIPIAFAGLLPIASR